MPANTTNTTPVVLLSIRPERKRSKVGMRVLSLLADHARVIVVGSDHEQYAAPITEQYGTEDTVVIVSDIVALSTRTNVTNAAKRFERKLSCQALDASDTNGDVRIVAYVFGTITQ